MPEIERSRFYKLSEVTSITGIPQSTLTKYAREGRIKATKVGKLWRMTGDWVIDFMQNGTEDPEEKQKKVHDLLHGFAVECRNERGEE